ncbi:MAG: hypothetical protein RL348_132 [Bacteroidota bacterium]|jgi:hypothetical protein
MNQRVKDFCQGHDIRIVDKNKRVEKVRPLQLRYFTNSMDYNEVKQDYIYFDTEQLYTVEIRESELVKIAEFESEVFNHMRQRGHYDMFNWIMEQKEREKYLKEKYPAVKKAYEQYSLMLKMAEAGEL